MQVMAVLEPIFDRAGRTVGWLNDCAVLDREARALAFVDRGGVFAYDGQHRGWLQSGLFYDRRGRAVAFTTQANGRVSLPLTEAPPLPPVVPVPRLPPVPRVPPLNPVWSCRWSDDPWDAVLGPTTSASARAAPSNP